MFTQCPSCETTFQVTAELLKAANGDVRCGQCLAVFNALDNLSEIEPDSGYYETDNPATTPDTESEPTITGDPNTSIDKNLEEFFGDLFEDSPNKTFDEPIAYASSEASTETAASPDGGFFYGANEATIEKILEVEEANPLETKDETGNEVEIAANSGVENGVESGIFILDEDELVPANSSVEKNSEVETSESLLDLIEKIDVTNADVTSADVTGVDVTEPDNKPEETIDTSNIPAAILDELQAAKAQQLTPPNTPLVAASIVLMLIFFLQAVYFSRNSLAKNPSYRPLLASVCNVVGCEINIEFDTRLIEIIGRDVRSHPASKKALIAGTTLINNASYAQPYPLLTLTFSDITGTKLAQRRFTPREYLRSGTDIAVGMPSEIPIQVELHLVDPGKAAVNFEFVAEVDPRSPSSALSSL